DYPLSEFPNGPPRDAATGIITQSPERAPLIAPNVIGRNKVSQGDVPLPQSRYGSTIETITGQPVQYLPASQMGTDLGRTYLDAQGRPVLVELRNDILPGHREMVQAHEFGHVVHTAARNIPTTGLEHELEPVYNTLNNSARTPNGLHADPAA